MVIYVPYVEMMAKQETGLETRHDEPARRNLAPQLTV